MGVKSVAKFKLKTKVRRTATAVLAGIFDSSRERMPGALARDLELAKQRISSGEDIKVHRKARGRPRKTFVSQRRSE